MNCEQILRDTYNGNRKGKNRRNIKLPSKLDFSLKNNELEIFMPQEATVANMWTDHGAFESWVLAFMSWTNVDKVRLDWESPSDPKKPNYQRFIYRVEKFLSLFPESFETKNATLLEHSERREGLDLIMNVPMRARDTYTNKNATELRTLTENELERTIIHDSSGNSLKKIFDLAPLDRQLPVGLFRKYVKKENRIFTGGKSAIDLWGVDGKDRLYLFELKKYIKGPKLGIVSELLFYTMVANDIQEKIFTFQDKDIEKAGPKSPVTIIPKTKSIAAYFLTPECQNHPLMDQKDNSIIDLLNGAMKSADMKINFGKIGIYVKDQSFEYRVK